MTIDWMHALALHYEQACRQYPDQPLMLLCDIDGTIIDMRHMILSVLRSYDRAHGTRYFARLQLEDITVHENQVEKLLEQLRIPPERCGEVLRWYMENRWTPSALYEMHRPFQGVLDVIRWFQIQPNVTVALVTGRPNTLREDTLRSLNQLGKPHRVQFTDEQLFMNPGDWEEDVAGVKVAGLEHYRRLGYHVFAFIDNEPANLKALAAADSNHDLLLLHANTIFESKRTRVPRGTVKGKEYRLAHLIRHEKVLPRHVQLVWHGVNDEANLRQFLASNIRWAEFDARAEPGEPQIILRHDSTEETPTGFDEELLTLEGALSQIKAHNRAAKIDIKGNGEVIDQVLALIRSLGFKDTDLWFNSNIEHIKETGFRRLKRAHPKSIIQCPIDFLTPMIFAAPDKAHEILEMLTGWGINRFSISWQQTDLRWVFDQMDRWGYEVNIYNVLDLESFLQAVLLLPRSVTSDFNFPQWHYYGRGSGRHGDRYEYTVRKARSHR